MVNPITNSYNKYLNSKNNFEVFHNNVINMPRANFSELDEIIKLMKSIACYIRLIDEEILMSGLNYKTIYHHIFINYHNGIVPQNNRNISFEERYLNRNESFDFLYSDAGKLGRMFRHYMGYFCFFGIIKDGNNRNSKYVDLDSLDELILTPNSSLFDIFRNKILNFNINSNDYLKNSNGFVINEDSDYRPARAIVKYVKEINRPATSFEISILLGRIDEVQLEKDILFRAINIGKTMPITYEDQKKQFFGCMGWKSGNTQFEYAQSQSPQFKFKVFLLFMKVFGLINFDETTNLITLTQYSEDLVGQDVEFEMLDLENLLMKVDDDTEDSNILTDIILRKRTAVITKAIQDDSELVEKLNKRNIRNPIIKNGKRVRSKLIAELSKIKADYLDEVSRKNSFEGKNGRNYVESHHIIEFNGENGPDITDNLICLGPENHSLIHHGSANAVDDFYNTCKTRGVITFERFKTICVKYRCLTTEHVKVLVAKKLISKTDAEELNNLITIHGVDSSFLASLNTPTVVSD